MDPRLLVPSDPTSGEKLKMEVLSQFFPPLLPLQYDAVFLFSSVGNTLNFYEFNVPFFGLITL